MLTSRRTHLYRYASKTGISIWHRQRHASSSQPEHVESPRNNDARLIDCPTITQDFKRGNDPSGIIPIKDHVVEPTPSNCEFMYVPASAPQLPNSNAAESATRTLSLAGARSLRGIDRTYRFKADDEGMAHRWITALRAVQVSCKLGNQIGFRPNSHTART